MVRSSLVKVVYDLLLQLSSALFFGHGLQVSNPRHLINLLLPLLALLTSHLVELLLRQLALFEHTIQVVLPEHGLETVDGHRCVPDNLIRLLLVLHVDFFVDLVSSGLSFQDVFFERLVDVVLVRF